MNLSKDKQKGMFKNKFHTPSSGYQIISNPKSKNQIHHRKAAYTPH
jgi:hypothetical protein